MPFFRTFFAVAPRGRRGDRELRGVKPDAHHRADRPSRGGSWAPRRARAAARATRRGLPIDPDPDPSTRPDLSALPAWAISTNHHERRGLPLVRLHRLERGARRRWSSRASAPGRQETMDAFQYFYDSDGDAISRAPVGSFQFDHRGGHHHWHFLQFVRYSILNAATSEVVRSFKQSFCLAPTDSIDLTVPRRALPPVPAGDVERLRRPGGALAARGAARRLGRHVLPVGRRPGLQHHEPAERRLQDPRRDEPARPPQGSVDARTTSKTATSCSSAARAPAR